MPLSPSLLRVWNDRLAAVAEEMGAVLVRGARSPNIQERRDLSCAILDEKGRLVAQAAHIPVHLGGLSMAVRAVMEAVPLADGECAIVNDPFAGGSHLPDVTLVGAVDAPSTSGGPPVRFYLACRAHHADVGGAAPGSFAVARGGEGVLPRFDEPVIAVGPRYGGARGRPRAIGLTLDDEGARLGPCRFTDEVAEDFARRSRTPDERRGDLAAQRAAIAVGRRRLLSLCARRGAEAVAEAGAALCDYTARVVAASLRALPAGTFAFADSLDDDGAGTEAIGIRARVTVRHDGPHGAAACFDFSDSDDESPGALNAVLGVTTAAVAYAVRLLCSDDTPANDGLLAAVELVAPEGTIVNARPPRAVAAGNVETSQRIVDVLLGALAQALPARIPAASAGTMTNVGLGGPLHGGGAFAYYETVPGGSGGWRGGDGASAVQTHMTNTWSTPVESIERALPVRVAFCRVRRGSGGLGKRDGGDGLERCFELLAPTTVTVVCERQRRPPYGLAGGGPGATGETLLVRDGVVSRLAAKCTFAALAGDRLILRTPGGGGWGDPRQREDRAPPLAPARAPATTAP